MSLQSLKEKVCNEIDRMAQQLLSVSHEIHANPELGMKEYKAAALIAKTLEENGLQVSRRAYGLETAFESEFGTGDCCVALLAEYDALPNIGHACGHNLIATAALGATLALAKLNTELPGRIRFLGTPAEENVGGKELMARAGAFEGVDAALMIHPSGVNAATMPCICVATAHVVYRGRAAHASVMPHRGLNALDALVTAYQSIAQLRQHIKPTERLHGIFTEAGDAANIVPARSAGQFMVRAADEADLAELKKRVQDCLEAGATATGCDHDVEWGEVDYLDLKTNWPLARAYQANAEALGREFIPIEKLLTGGAGSTDMGNVSYRVPAIHPLMACSPKEVTIHNPEFTVYAGSASGDQAALDGAKALAMTALDFMRDEDLRASTREEFVANVQHGV